MKIMVITEGFFPGKKYGGPPVSINNLCNIMENIDFYVIAKNHDLGEKKKYSNIKDGWNNGSSNMHILYLSDKDYNKKKFEEIIKEINPNIVYLQSLFQKHTIPCLAIAKKNSINVLLAPRGELCKGAFKKKWKKIPYIFFLRFFGLTRRIHVQSTSDEETEMIKRYLKINPKKIHYLTNVPTIPKNLVNKNYKNIGEIKIVFLSRIVSKKNLLYALDCLANLKGRIIFDIYGSIEDKEYWELCLKRISELPSNITVQYKGIIEHDRVCITFSKYDLFFFPTKSENFGHVIVEALIAGCPIIISDRTPFINLKENCVGADIDLNNKSLFEKELQSFVKIDNDEWKKMSIATQKYIVDKLKISNIKEKYNETFKTIEKEN